MTALQDTALAGVGIVFLAKGWWSLLSGMGQISYLLSERDNAFSDSLTFYLRASTAWTILEGVLLAVVGVFLVLRTRAVARSLWRDGPETLAALTCAGALMHLVGLIALYRLVPLLVKLPGAVWFTVSLAMSEDTGPMHHDGGERLFLNLFVVLVCLVCLAKARPLGGWMARRAGLAG